MNARDARELIAIAIGTDAGTWADLGAGHGTFTQALATILPPGSRIYAVDRDSSAVADLRRLESPGGTELIAVQADFAEGLENAGIGEQSLDGMLLANALHFVRDQEAALASLVKSVRAGGRVVLVEYDRRSASRWVPYPISMSRWEALATAAGLSKPTVTATRPSEYDGILFASVARR